MEYRQVPPPCDLAPWVECVWLLRGALAPQGKLILPDGRLELVFHFAAKPETANGRQPGSLIAGRMVTAIELRAGDDIDAIGIRMRPEAAGCLLPCDSIAETECMEAVLGPWAARVRETVGNAANDVARLALLWDLLRARIARVTEPDGAVAESIRRIEIANGQGSVDAFLPNGLGSRQWQRRFLRASGFSPKAFARITRFQYVIGLCESMERRDWANVALAAGFYDQPHLVNEFRAFTGQSPEAYLQAGRGMAEFYHDGFFQDGRRERM